MNRLNFALTIALTSSLAVIATLCCRPASCQPGESDYTAKLRAPLTAFKAKYARELNAIPRLKVIAGETKNNDASVLEASGRNALALGNLDEAEVAFATSLSLQENGLSRLAYAMVLIEEKKYLEAIPSCAEVALVDRYQQTLNSNDRGVELRSAPHILLAYALAQIGEVKTAAIIYNYAVDRRMSEINLEIERNSRDLRQDRKSVV